MPQAKLRGKEQMVKHGSASEKNKNKNDLLNYKDTRLPLLN